MKYNILLGYVMNYKEILKHSFEVEKAEGECLPTSRLEYLANYIFDFTTYDEEMDRLFAEKAVEVCAAINDGKTFEYIKDPENYRWYLLMCNMPFFIKRLEWGTSIRGAWWKSRIGKEIEFQSCGIWDGDNQLHEKMKFDQGEWEKFIAAVIEFAAPEMKHVCLPDNLIGEYYDQHMVVVVVISGFVSWLLSRTFGI